MISQKILVNISSVAKSYGKHNALKGVTATVQEGEFLALLGPNGAGKTTLFKLLLGLIAPTSGSVSINDNQPISLGYLPENVAFYDTMTGREVLTFYARLKKTDLLTCNDLLKQVDLLDAADRRIGTYSKGMRQRLGLAQALLGDPRLLVLDEPTTGLDPDLRRRFFDIIQNLQKKGVTIIVSSHGLSEIETHADRYLILHNGNLLAKGSLEHLKQKTKLPIRIKITVPAGQASEIAQSLKNNVSLHQVSDTYLELDCQDTEKSNVIRAITALGPLVHDLEINPPHLDDVYATLMNERSAL